MLIIEKTVLPSPEQWMMVIEGARNPMNSWHKIDSYITHIEDQDTLEVADYEFFLGETDEKLLRYLSSARPSDAKFRRMIPVYLTINAPLYWWKEFDTYKVATVSNSCSTMHKIHAKEFTLDDFSCEHLQSDGIKILEELIHILNIHRDWFVAKAADNPKIDWWQMIQLLPTSYNQKRTIFLNYEVLANIYRDRRTHKLDEWHVLCDWIEKLPYSHLITGKEPTSDE